ncbi:hypothetical protein PHLCEN_2v5682 [Hermanssonia centrifuga]|uniref:DUF6589 domain-containing protein n=1 Tax=Hermanssonia centrifuga TaxID=98765 RepID=A0A2R6P1N7_9APHY|nr:hypothetical protein PHLCEN_2v5682 [Hermanssonia centrifuga]
MALRGHTASTASGEQAIPCGTPWTPPASDVTSQSMDSRATKDKKKSAKAEVSAAPTSGDQTLAQSIMYMHVTLISREVASAIAKGDIGRVYEGIKVSNFWLHIQCTITYLWCRV